MEKHEKFMASDRRLLAVPRYRYDSAKEKKQNEEGVQEPETGLETN